MAPPSTPDKYPPPEAFDKIITINVGVKTEDAVEGTNTFKVHKGVLCFYSGYFDACLNGQFAEAFRGAVDLAEDDPGTFKHFVAWLYTRQLPLNHEAETGGGQWQSIIRLWVLADKREVPLLANRCINALRELIAVRWEVPINRLKFVYGNTTPDSPLRRFIIFYIAVASGLQVKDEQRQNFPADALWDMLKLSYNRDTSKYMSFDEILAMDLCQYHQHEKDVRCPPESTAHIKRKTKS
ncbi:hypothetical protein CKM354_000893100 [Cercospora kikuchii]|uniref:BTB domain-containing protein n=1 Tax=Cercospora kikuchii TaxID=84275 RepID=A0A9P3CWR9_9PEZI|nr:uncharacterized protein CKM354_000893100 [Cercospora kikuchii]GIZ45778.1 hypothetical protein CKM354_000893100 [Cercospora kikuchii]